MKDVKYIQDNLKTIKNNVYILQWNHLDFIWALDAKPVLYDKIVEILKEETKPVKMFYIKMVYMNIKYT